MQYVYPSEKIYLAKSSLPKAGRGVFARVPIAKEEIIELCPVIQLPVSDYNHIKQSVLFNYYFEWGEEHAVAIGLGFASLYNHSYNPNATYIKEYKEKLIRYKAIVDIKKDEEILVNYNLGNPTDTSSLWISDIPNYQH